MSYILDALKKSEEERHQGQVPNLGGNSTLIHSSGNKSAVWPWIIVALLLLNMLVIAYWLMIDTPSEAFVESSPASVVTPEREPEYIAASEYAAPKAQVRKPIASYPKNNLRVDSDVVAETPHSKVVPPKTLLPTVASDLMDEEPMLITPKNGARAYNGPAYVEEVEDVSIDEPDVSSVRHASDFSQSFQRRIPDLAFNSHIYTDTPESRRVMINNIYLREGQAFSGLTVVQITEAGVVLSLDGQAFKVGVLRDWNSPR